MTIERVGWDPRLPKSESERWAEELLANLRQARFGPIGWLTFFSASFARARHKRVERARAHRQVFMLGGAGLAVWSAVAAFGWPLLGVIALAWWVLVLLMVDWHLGMLERADGSAPPGLGIANVLTLMRAAAVPLLPVLASTPLGLAVLAAGLTDVGDGFLARSREEASRLGAWLDGTVDGIFLSVAAAAAANDLLLPDWVAALVVARYLAPWLVLSGVYFASATAPSRAGYVSGRAPGAAVVVGLTLAAFGVPGAAFVAAGGALSGLATFAATILRGVSRVRSARARAETAVPGGR